MVLSPTETYVATLFLAVTLSIFGRKMYLRLRYLFAAKGVERRWDHVPTRIKNFVVYGIVTSLLLYNAADIAVGTASLPEWKPISSALAAVPGVVLGATWWRAFWWTHVLLLFSFLAYVPHSKHMHIIFAIVNTFFMDLTPKGTLKKVDLEKTQTFGVDRVEQLSWRQRLDGYACTECGRCTAACPANATGKPLDPMR